MLIRLSPLKYFDVTYSTPEQKHTKTVDGFTISLIDKFITMDTHSYNGNSYKRDLDSLRSSEPSSRWVMWFMVHWMCLLLGHTFKDNTMVTVTAPMGSIDIPISREGMEDTDRNNRLVERANKALKTLATQDVEKFKNKTLIELADEYVGELSGSDRS